MTILSMTTTAKIILDIRVNRKEYTLQNQGSITIFLGDKSVETSGTRTGRMFAAGVIETSNNKDDPETIKGPLYGIVKSGTCNIWVEDK